MMLQLSKTAAIISKRFNKLEFSYSVVLHRLQYA